VLCPDLLLFLLAVPAFPFFPFLQSSSSVP
jgi:hypothetical protein